MTLEGKVALVTGGGSGIGRATAMVLADQGARVAILSRDPEEVQSAVDEIRAKGCEALGVAADVRDPRALQDAVARIDAQWGRLDIVFANAGINGVWAPIEELTPEEWDETLDVNLKGTFLTIKYAAPLLKRQGGAVIITSSVNGTRIFSNTGATAYSASKAGQVAIAKMLALEFAKDRVRVNVICPGAFESEIDENTEKRGVEETKQPAEYPEGKVPLTRGVPGDPVQIGHLVAYLASDVASHISGTEIWIDGAESLLVG